MGEYREVRHERLFVKVPGTDRLRRNAAGRLRHLLDTGWRETERSQTGDYIKVRLERSGQAPRNVKLKPPPPPPARRPRGEGRDFRGRPSGPRG